MKVYNPNAEERAFLYQEAQALEPLVKDLGGPITVMVEEFPQVKSGRKRRDQGLFRVSFVLSPEAGGLTIQATDKNLYDATIAAKAEAERTLNAVVNAIPHKELPASGPLPSPYLH